MTKKELSEKCKKLSERNQKLSRIIRKLSAKSRKLSAESRKLSALQAEKPAYNAIILYGYVYDLITDFHTTKPCKKCDLVKFCHAIGNEPGMCAIFEGTWSQYFRRRKVRNTP